MKAQMAIYATSSCRVGGKIKRDDTEKDPLSTTPNVIFDRVVSILGMSIGRWLVGGRKLI
jgi:hypothetical protein